MTRRRTLWSLSIIFLICLAAFFIAACEGGESVEEVTAAEHTHTYGEWTVTAKPSCVLAGERSHTCTICLESESEEVPATGHEYSEAWGCDQMYHWHECAICAHKDRTAHNLFKETCLVCDFNINYSANLVYTLNSGGTSYSVSGKNIDSSQKIIEIAPTFRGLPVIAIAKGAFVGKSFEEIIIPASVGIIGDEAFANCTSLVNAHLRANLSSIGVRAFAGCTSLGADSVLNIPRSVRSIGDYAFLGCTKLEQISLTSVTDLGEGVFSGCTLLKEVELSTGLLSIKANTFAGCSALESITLPESMTTIGSGAFFACTALSGIVIPASLMTIETNTFFGCASLIEVEFKTTEGWSVSADSAIAGLGLAVTDKSVNATNLTSTYCEYYWKR